jgi:hypothetical protein
LIGLGDAVVVELHSTPGKRLSDGGTGVPASLCKPARISLMMVVALRIIESAKAGERDPLRLKAHALAGLSSVVIT